MSVNKRKKKKQGREYLNGFCAVDGVLYLYLFAIFGIYPWIMDNQYFNITITRYKFFMGATIIFIILAIAAGLVDILVAHYYGMENMNFTDAGLPACRKPEFYMGVFILSQFFAWILAEDRQAALTGENGRRMGFLFYVIVALMYMIICYRAKVREYILMIFAATSAFAYIVAIFQHMGNDFMGYKDNISPKCFDIFISTIGNINIFASFLSVTVPVFAAFAVFSENRIYRLTSHVVLVLAGMCIITANSDSAYLGIGAAMLLMFFIAYKKKMLTRLTLTLVSLATGNAVTVIMNHTVIGDYNKRGGVSESLDNVGTALAMLLVSVIIFLFVRVFGTWKKSWLEGLNQNRVICFILAALAVIASGVVIYGVNSGASFFTFNYEWGTYRGYIWTKCSELFLNAPWRNKIFGYGNESIRYLMKTFYNEEMLAVTGKTYDNAHNELLQYLVTTGIFGLLSYIGLCLSSFVYILKRAGEGAMAYVCLAAMTGYFFQALINVNQPITTPYFFVFMALGVGFVREMERVK